MKSFSAIPIFVKVVECMSISQAATKLNISKSAVSKRISVLEQHLGVCLFQRTTRNISLTEAGEKFYNYASQSYSIACEGEDIVTSSQGHPQGLLKINTPMTFGRLHIAPLVSKFLKQYPGIELNMTMDDKMLDLVEGSYDIAIRIGDLPDSSLIARRIAPCLSVLCASPDYISKNSILNKPSDLENHNCLFYSYFQSGSSWTFNDLNRKIKIKPKGNFQVNNSEAICDNLISGLGICQLPTFIASPYLKSGALVSLLESYSLPIHSIFAVFPERKFLPEKVRVFLAFIIKNLGGENPKWDKFL